MYLWTLGGRGGCWWCYAWKAIKALEEVPNWVKAFRNGSAWPQAKSMTRDSQERGANKVQLTYPQPAPPPLPHPMSEGVRSLRTRVAELGKKWLGEGGGGYSASFNRPCVSSSVNCLRCQLPHHAPPTPAQKCLPWKLQSFRNASLRYSSLDLVYLEILTLTMEWNTGSQNFYTSCFIWDITDIKHFISFTCTT